MENLNIDQRIEVKIKELISLYTLYSSSDLSAHEMEKGLLSSLLSLGYILLKLIIEKKSRDLEKVVPIPITEEEKFKSKGLQHRIYLSIFGELSIYRTGYYSAIRGTYYELDSLLDLPSKKLSYNLQSLLGLSSTEQNYRKSVEVVNKLLGLNLSGTVSQRNAEDLGSLVENYYDSLEIEKIEEGKKGVCFIAYFDGKGVPKIQENKKEIRELKRLGKGEKRGKMQMATVSVSAYFTPKKRDKERIIKGLMEYAKKKVKEKKENQKDNKKEKDKELNDNKWMEGIHRRAFLADQARAVEYGLDYIRDRMTNPLSRFIVPIDAGSGLEEKVLKYVQKHKLTKQFDGIVLDIIHVLEYVWEAANCIFSEKSPQRINWVKKTLGQLLDSQTKQVIEKLEKIKKEKFPDKNNKIDQVISYFSNHQHKMDYKKFIDKGYPISSALAESTCGHLVKDRMEGAGKRWSSKGAQNMMDLRAVSINDDFDSFINFVIEHQQNNMLKKAA